MIRKQTMKIKIQKMVTKHKKKMKMRMRQRMKNPKKKVMKTILMKIVRQGVGKSLNAILILLLKLRKINMVKE